MFCCRLGRRTSNLSILFALAVGLAAANVWFAAQRSLIPVTVDGRLIAKEKRREKHPGKDDVYLLRLDPGGEVQVDQLVYKAVNERDRLRKAWFAYQLSIDGRQPLQLEWSRDLYGMLLAMPLVLLIFWVTGLVLAIIEKSAMRPRDA